MSVRQKCDRCVKVNMTDTPYKSVTIELFTNRMPNDGGISIDVCPTCEAVVIDLMLNRICNTFTPDDCKSGVFAPVEKPKRTRRKKLEDGAVDSRQTTVEDFLPVPEGIEVMTLTPDTIPAMAETIGAAVGDPMVLEDDHMDGMEDTFPPEEE